MIVTTRIRSSRRPALTLMEVMVVAAILVILAGVGAISVLGYLSSAKEQAAKVGVKNLEQAVGAYYLSNNTYPNELGDLTVTLPNGKAALLPQEALIDPWQQPYVYEPTNLNPNTKVPHIYSQGEPGSNRHITNWD
jgi:type II secretory pathway pseudopilin PulG